MNKKRENQSKISIFEFCDNGVKTITQSSLRFLLVIGIIGILIRIYYFPLDIPISLDSMDYFSYAFVITQQGNLPEGWDLSNNGWPIFLSIFFSIFNYENFLDYSNVQRIITVVISTLTIIPVYLLCTRFVNKSFSLIGATIFVLEPRIIINSLLGVTESSFVLLGTTALFLFLSKNEKAIFASFGVAALLSLIRYEGLLLIIPFAIIFIVRKRNEKKIILKLFTAMSIFILILIPMAMVNYQAVGHDGLVSPLFAGGPQYISKHVIQGVPDIDDPIYSKNAGENKFLEFISLGSINLIKFLGLIMIPIFIFFAPIGIFLFLKNRDFKTWTVISAFFVLLLPAFYAYGRGVEETRYLYIIYPILCIFCVYTIKKILLNFSRPNSFLILIVCGILVCTIGFLEYKKIDYEHENEAFLIAQKVVSISEGINHYPPESKYIHIAEISNKWPNIPMPKETSYNQSFEIAKISPGGYTSLENYIHESKIKGLTHLVVDGKQMNANFLNDIFYNEEKYQYLVKEYDSKDEGFNYHVKIFKINYELFEKE